MDEGLYNVCNQLGICMTGPPPVTRGLSIEVINKVRSCAGVFDAD
jgi:hypothetical protein